MMKHLLLLLFALTVGAPAWSEVVKPLPSGVTIELRGPAKDVSKLIEDLKKNAVYMKSACDAPAHAGDVTIINCAQASDGLAQALQKNTPTTVKLALVSGGDRVCTLPCKMIQCPPGGPYRCCNPMTYQTCPSR